MIDRQQLNRIEQQLEKYNTYEEIPSKFVQLLEEKFSYYSYIKGLLEMKRTMN